MHDNKCRLVAGLWESERSAEAPAGPLSLQAAALVGATVTGVLARKRREEMEALNAKLRHINAELRRQREEVGAGAGAAPIHLGWVWVPAAWTGHCCLPCC